MKTPNTILFASVITLDSTMVFVATQNTTIPLIAAGVIFTFLLSKSYVQRVESGAVQLNQSSELQVKQAFGWYVIGSFALGILGAFYAASETLRTMVI
jgi:hypothetical protein